MPALFKSLEKKEQKIEVEKQLKIAAKHQANARSCQEGGPSGVSMPSVPHAKANSLQKLQFDRDAIESFSAA